WEADANILHIGDSSGLQDFPPASAFSADVTLSGTGAATITANSVDGTNIALGSDAAGDIMRYGGTDWERLSNTSTSDIIGTVILDRDVTIATVSNSTAETTVYRWVVPANTLGTDRAIRITYLGDYLNNSGGSADFSLLFKYGSTTWATATLQTITADASRRAIFHRQMPATLSAANATNAQIGFAGMSITDPGPLDGTSEGLPIGVQAMHNSIAEDSTTDLVLTITASHDTLNANVSFRMHVVQVELM
ncbi:hypothetical protein LCGC14_2751030, partial [marine sediment metagenome]